MKSPLELVVSSLRTLNAEVTDTTAIAQRIADLGQPLYGKAEPTGYPNTSDMWASSAGLLGRMNFASVLTSGQIAGVKVDTTSLQGVRAPSGGCQASRCGAIRLDSRRDRERPFEQWSVGRRARCHRDRVTRLSKEVAMLSSTIFPPHVRVHRSAPSGRLRHGCCARRLRAAASARSSSRSSSAAPPTGSTWSCRSSRSAITSSGRRSPSRPPGAPERRRIDLDGRFALHPSLQPLKEFWDSGQLAHRPCRRLARPVAVALRRAGVHGIRHARRQDGRRLAESRAADGRRRMLADARRRHGHAAAAHAQGRCAAPWQSTTCRRSSSATRPVGDARAPVRRPQTRGSKAQGKGTFDAVRMIETIRKQPYTPANGAQYSGEFGQRLQQVARLIKADVGVEVAFADMVGWDHH